MSNSTGDAVYIGVLDETGANITSVKFSLTACAVEEENTSNCTDFAIDTLNLNASGGAPIPTVSVTPAGITFTTQFEGTTSAAKAVKVTNTSTNGATLNFTGITIAGSDPGDFTPSGCTSSLAPGKHCTISVTFKPTATGKRTGTLQISDNAATSPQTVDLSGKGTLVSLAPSPVAFPSATVGTKSSPIVVTLTNNNATTITVHTISISGPDKTDFAQTSTCSTPVTPKTCTISVTFTPIAKGIRKATLSVPDTDLGSPQTDALTGTGE